MLDGRGWDEDKKEYQAKRTSERLAASINGLSASDFAVNIPSNTQVGGDHYSTMAIQPSEYIYRNGLNWMEGNAIKYITRHNVKGGIQDIDKAIHYLELLKEWQYGPA